MSTKSTSLRRFSGYVLMLLLLCVSYSERADAVSTQVATASFATGLNHPSGWGALIQQTALDTYGDWLVVDTQNAALYEFPANGGAEITLVAAGLLGGNQNPGIAIDSNNNLYLEANYNNCLLMFPFDTATMTWDGLSTLTAANTAPDVCPNGGGGTSPLIFAQYGLTVTGAYPGYYQPWGITVDPNNNLVIGGQNSPNYIFRLNVVGSGAAAKHGTGSMVLDKMTTRPISVAVDKWNNIYFVEDAKGLSGAYEIPAGSPELTADTDPAIVRIDPKLPNVTGVQTDANGNVYVSDGTKGVFLIPNTSGTPETASAILLSPVPAQGEVAVDLAHNILYVPTTQVQSNGLADVAEVKFNAAALGSVAAGKVAATASTVPFSFGGAGTPASFAIQEAGAATPDFTLASGGSCATGTAYAALSSCSVNVTLAPHVADGVSAKLLMLDGSSNTLASMTLEGTGTGSAVQVEPGAESAVGSGLKTPSQVAVDAAGNTYVADSGLGAVEMFAKGSSAGVAVGTGLVSPTGVAVDGSGDVFIADSGNGTVVEVPDGPGGLNSAGQMTLKTGLGTNLKLAVDRLGDLYISDPDNSEVVKLENAGAAGVISLLNQVETDLTGFSTPSALAVDASGNLYVADGSNLLEVTPSGTQSTVLSTLSNVTGLAVDASGSVYVTSGTSTVRIPDESGTLNQANQTTVALAATNPTSVAVDSGQNLYVTDATAEDVDFVSTSASTDFGTLTSSGTSQNETYTLANAGNSPLNITGFAGTPDFSETATTCNAGPVASGSTCSATITFSPGPGDQGPLSGVVAVQSDAANSPVGMNVMGVGAPLAASTTSATVTGATVDATPVVVTVVPVSGTSPVPTGQVTVSVSGNGLTAPMTASGSLTNGTVTLTLTQLPAGSYQIAVNYIGDTTYAHSSTSLTATVGAGPVTLVQPTAAQVQLDDPGYPYVLSSGAGAAEPYDGSVTPFEYTYTVQVIATDGAPLIGQPVYDSKGKLTGMNYGSVTFQGAPYTAAGVGCPPVPVNSDGTAPFNTTCFTIDTTNSAIPNIQDSYTITPVYSPAGVNGSVGYTNPNYTAATGTAISFTALRNPMVVITANPGSMNVTAGSTATSTLTLTSLLGYGYGGHGSLLNNYSLPVQLECDGLPAYATCSFTYPNPDSTDPQSVDVGPPGGTTVAGAVCQAAQGCYGPGTVIMTVTTNVPTGMASLRNDSPGTIFAAMFGLGILTLIFGKKKKSLRGRLLAMTCVLLCCCGIAGINGCTTKQLGTNNGTATPSGTYKVLVTGKEVGSQVITSSPYITYGNRNQVSLPFTMNVTIQ
ncbi:MAG TPA: Ig-like domain repeat protein [Acidobacteriaceae bacterium]